MLEHCRKFQKYIDIARALHEKDSNLRCQHTCICVYKNKIISIGRNSKKTSSFNLYNPKIGVIDGRDITGSCGTCAESVALKRVRNLTNIPFEKIKMFVIRIDNNNKAANSKPCFSCSSLADFLDVREIYYTNKFGFWERFK